MPAAAPRPLGTPHPDRLSPSQPEYLKILQVHRDALGRGDSFYTDPASGLLVLTAGYLLSRGSCCGRDCRHCPYVS